MGKDFGKTETNAQFFYGLLKGGPNGFSDEKIDGALADNLKDASNATISKAKGPTDGKIQGSEAIAVAFNQFTRYHSDITNHFQQLGLDIAEMLNADGSIKRQFVDKISAQLSGTDISNPRKTLNYQATRFYVAQQYQLSPVDPEFSRKFEDFLLLPEKDRQEKIQNILRDRKSVDRYAQWLFRYSEFSLLPFKNQLEILKQQLGGNESLAKDALSPLWQNRSLPKLIAQAALLRGRELEAQANALSTEEAQKKIAAARLLFCTAAELDNHNALVRRRLSVYLMREGNLPAASSHLAAAVKDEGDLLYLLEIVHGMEKNDKRLLNGSPDAWSFVASNLLEAKRYSDAAALWREAAKAAADRGDQAASLAFTEQALLADEAGKPYDSLFTRQSNPIAVKLYQALRDQGIPSALLDGHVDSADDAPDRKISVAEVFRYYNVHWAEPRVQAARKAVNFPELPWETPGADLPYADEAFYKLDIFGKMAVWSSYDAAEMAKRNGPKDIAAIEKRLRRASYCEPKNPDRQQALGNFYLTQKAYRKAADSYEAAFAAGGGTNLSAKVGAAVAYFHLGEFKNSRDAYTVVLQKKPRDATLLKLRAEASQGYLALLNPGKNGDEIRKVQSELDADSAMAIAVGAEAQKARLAEIEKQLPALHEGGSGDAAAIAEMAGIDPTKVPADSKKEILAVLEGLGEQYLQLAEQKYADPKDVEFVSKELHGLAGEIFAMLSRFAKADSDSNVYKLTRLYEGYQLLVDGKIDEAMKSLKVIRKTVSAADKILKKIENDRLSIANLAALDVWKAYRQESMKLEDDHLKGIWGRAFNTEGKAAARATERATEEALMAELKSRLDDGRAYSLKEALGQIKDSGPETLKVRASFYLDDGDRAAAGHPIRAVIDFVDHVPPEPEAASQLLQKGLEFEYGANAVEAPFAIYSLVNALAPEVSYKGKPAEHMAALQGHSSFSRSADKFIHSIGGMDLSLDLALMFVSAGLGNLMKLEMLVRLERAGIVGYKAGILANAVGIGLIEVPLFSVGNTIREAMSHDIVFTAGHLLRSYGANLAMIGGLKGFGKLGETLGPRAAKRLGLVAVAEGGATLTTGGKALVWGIGHASGLSGIIATGLVGRARGSQPIGGWKEGLVHDVFSYVEFAVAHKMTDRVFRGKLTEVGQRQHREIAYREAVLLAKGHADALGFKAQRYKVKVAKDGSISVDGRALNSLDPDLRTAIEKKLAKGKDGKIRDQTLFLDSEDRQLLVDLFVKTALNYPGFANRRLVKWIAAKDYQKANAYFKEYGLPLTVDAQGRVVAGPTDDASPHAALGIEAIPFINPASDEPTTPDAPRPDLPPADGEAPVCTASPFSDAGKAHEVPAFDSQVTTPKVRVRVRFPDVLFSVGDSGPVLPGRGGPDPTLAGPSALRDLSNIPSGTPRTPRSKPPPPPPKRVAPPLVPDVKPKPPTYEQYSRRAGNADVELTALVEVSDTILRGQVQGWQDSGVGGLYPDRSHFPITMSRSSLNEAQYEAAKVRGGLKDTAPATYTIHIHGKQRRTVILARLRARYGQRISPVDSDAKGNTWLLRNELGEAQVSIVMEARDPSIPNAAEVRAIYAEFGKHLSQLYSWAKKSDPRGEYAFRVLGMIGVETSTNGKLRFGTRVARLLKQVEMEKDPATLARAKEELVMICAYLKDVAVLVPEYHLLQEGAEVSNDSDAEGSVYYALKQETLKPQAQRAQRAMSSLGRLGANVQGLGESLRREVPAEARRPGNELYDAYMKAQAELSIAIQEVKALKNLVVSLGVDPSKELPQSCSSGVDLSKEPPPPQSCSADDPGNSKSYPIIEIQ